MSEFEQNLFVIVGAQRSGTTYLYENIAKHPDIIMNAPVKPEPKFFINDELYSRGPEYYKDNFFPKVSLRGHRCRFGEKSTSYLEYDYVASRIKKMFPLSRAIAVLRNPAERAISNYYFSKMNGHETRPLWDALFNFKKDAPEASNVSVSPYAYIDRGKYDSYIKNYIDIFGDDLLVLIFEDLIANQSERDRLFHFLKVPSIVDWNSNNVVNKSDRPQMRTIEEKRVIQRLASTFEPSIERLEHLLNRDLSLWRISRLPSTAPT